MTPGSLPLSTEIYQEGIIIPPLKLYKAGVLNEDVLRLILRNVRTPDERRGDLAAQRAAAAVGARRLRDLAATHGRDEVLAYAGHLCDYSERITRAAIASWPDGAYTFEDVIELVEGEQLTLAPIRRHGHHRRRRDYLRLCRHIARGAWVAQCCHRHHPVGVLLRRALPDGG